MISRPKVQPATEAKSRALSNEIGKTRFIVKAQMAESPRSHLSSDVSECRRQQKKYLD
jgi:hypothetical protein